VPTDVAAALAAQRRVRVHTVGIGSAGEVAMARRSGPGRALRTQRHDFDPESLRRIAETTGGRFFHARSSAALPEIYRAIDELERVPRELPPRPVDAPLPEPFLALGGALLALELATARLAWRRLP
jgi:Ca-activated chloride channel family protein